MASPGLPTSAFPREYAVFAGLIGDGLRRPIVKSVQKWQDTPAPLRPLYGDRYDIQRQLLAFESGSPAFRLDASDPLAVRTAGFIAGINRMAARLDDTGRHRLARRVLGDLAPGQDIRHLEFETRVFHHLERKNLFFHLADQEGLGDFDFLVHLADRRVDLECKTATGSTGSDLKDEDQVLLGSLFLRHWRSAAAPDESGLFILTLKLPRRAIPNLAQVVTAALRAWLGRPVMTDTLTLDWERRPAWDAALAHNDPAGLYAAITTDSARGRDFAICPELGGHRVGLVVRPATAPTMAQKLADIIQAAGGQCSRTRAAVIWLDLIGFDEAEFRRLAAVSMAGTGGGLNTIFANSFHPALDRQHIGAAQFSMRSERIATAPRLDSTGLLTSVHSLDAPVYIIPNPTRSFGEVHGF